MNINKKIDIIVPDGVSDETAANLLREMADKLGGKKNTSEKKRRKRCVYRRPQVGAVYDYEGNGIPAFLKTPWGWMSINGRNIHKKIAHPDRVTALEHGVTIGTFHPCKRVGTLAALLGSNRCRCS